MRRGNSQNLQHHLLLRELNIYPGLRHPIPSHFLFHEKNFYKSITPRLTVQNIAAPQGYFRRFTPDGKLFTCFTADQKAMIVYQYMGVGNIAELVSGQKQNCIGATDLSYKSLLIRQDIFDSVFQTKYIINVVREQHSPTNNICRDFSLFLDEGNYMLLASVACGAIFPKFLAYFEYADLFDDIELYDYTFHLVDLRKGCITDNVKMDSDYIILPHNYNVSAYQHNIAILSTYRQCIEIYQFDASVGKLERLFVVGTFGSALDRDLILAHHATINFTLDSTNSIPYSHLKQKIFAYLYKKIMDIDSVEGRKIELKKFYSLFEQFERMIIAKMQLIDSDIILLRYENKSLQTQLHLNRIDQFFRLYIFYGITEQKVWKVFPDDSTEILQMVRNSGDEFRNTRSLQVPWNSTSPSNNVFLRAAFDHAVQHNVGGPVEAAKRLNPTIPIPAQSYSTSPYLDCTIFHYDERAISPLDRPKHFNTNPICVFDRNAGHLKFRVCLEKPYPGSASPADLSQKKVLRVAHFKGNCNAKNYPDYERTAKFQKELKSLMPSSSELYNDLSRNQHLLKTTELSAQETADDNTEIIL